MPRLSRVEGLICLAVVAGLYIGFNGPGRTVALVTFFTDSRAANSDFFQNWGGVVDFARGGMIYQPLRPNFDRFRPHLGAVYGPVEPSPHSGITGPDEKTVLAVNAHPPFATLLCLPLSGMTYSAAYTVFNAIGVILIVAAGVLLLTRGGPAVPSLATRAALFLPFAMFIVSSAPLRDQFVYANWNALLLFLLTAGWRLAASGRYGLAGGVVGLAALIKLYPGLVVLAFVPRERRAGLLGFAAVVLAGTAITAAVFGISTHISYVREVLPAVRMQTSVLNVSLVATAGRLFDPTQPFIVPLMRSKAMLVAFVAACGTAMLGPLAWRVLRNRALDADGLYAALVTASVILSPVAYGHNLLLVMLPAWIILTHAVYRKDRVVPVVLTLAACVLWFSVGELHGMLYRDGKAGQYLPWESLTTLSAHAYAVLVVHMLACRLALTPDPPLSGGADGG
jgi:hypothetical protein